MWTAIDSFKGISESTSITFYPLPTTSECTKLSHILRSLSKRNHLFSYMYITSIQFMYGSFCCIFPLDILGIPICWFKMAKQKKHLQKLLALIHHFISETKVSSLMFTTWLDFFSASLLRASLYSTWNIWKSYVYVVWTFSSLVNEYIPFHWKSVQRLETVF